MDYVSKIKLAGEESSSASVRSGLSCVLQTLVVTSENKFAPIITAPSVNKESLEKEEECAREKPRWEKERVIQSTSPFV